MKVMKLLLLKGKANSGKSTVLKSLINLLGTWKKCSRLFMCRGACVRMKTSAIVFGHGDVIAVFEIKGRIVVIVTFGDAPYDAEKVHALLVNIQSLIGRKVDLLIAALRDTRKGGLERSYQKLFGSPVIFAKTRTPGQAPVDDSNLNADDTKTLRDICKMVADVTRR